MLDTPEFNIVEASIEEHKEALSSGQITSVELVISYLIRIAIYDINGGLNAFTVFNPKVIDEAANSDARRATGQPLRPLEGIPYTLKDSFKYESLSVTNGSPALAGLESSSDSAIAAKLRAAGAILIGKTNMPPMAAGGMQRGLYGRAESPYNSKYLTAAFSSGSSNGAATSTTTSMAVFGLGSETVSSGRSPASNNALVAYTPSRGILSCRGLWPLYVTCDVPVPYARSINDLFHILSVIAEPDEEIKGDFWREQRHVELPRPQKVDYHSLTQPDALKGKRVGIPKMYIGEDDSDPHAKPTTVHPDVISLWEIVRTDLEALGAEVVHVDFPLVTNYENDSVSGQANNVVGCPSDWNEVERSTLIAKAWDDFLRQNNDPKLPSLASVDPLMLFPKPKGYLPDTWVEVRNLVQYGQLPDLAAKLNDTSIFDLPGLKQALTSLEAQRKRDLEDRMNELNLDCVVFPANGDVGFADLEFELESARHSLQNGVKYSNGNRAIRHLGVPTVSVPMGIMKERNMPVNLTFAGKAYEDEMLLRYAWAYEQRSKRRISPPSTPQLATDAITRRVKAEGPFQGTIELSASAYTKTVDGIAQIRVAGAIRVVGNENATVEVYLDGSKGWSATIENDTWETALEHKCRSSARLGWDLKPLPQHPVMVLVVVRAKSAATTAKLLWVSV